MKTVSIFVLIVFTYNLCQSQDDELVNHEVNAECSIPNQRSTKGLCNHRKNCLEYDDLFNVTELTTERLSFIMNLDCGFDYETWKTLVCCPKPGNSYK